MLLKKVKNRFSILISLSIISLIAIFLILKVLEDNVLYFYSPSDIKNSDDINLKKKNKDRWHGKKGIYSK